MAEEHHNKSHEFESTVVDEGAVETKDRGLFDFLGKKEEKKPQEEVIVTEFEKVQISEPEPKFEGPKEEEEKKPGLVEEKLHRSGSSSSSSSSDEEEGEGEEKKKKKEKKGSKLKDKLKEKISGEKEEEKFEDTVVPVEVVEQEPPHPEEKKGFLDKIKDKLPGQHKKTDEVPPPPPPVESATPEAPSHEVEAKEKKGLLEKIKEKIPGYHPKTEEEKEKEKEKETH